jgi:hypothetical protein
METCQCYGCTIERQRAGIVEPDRSADPCDPPNACAIDGNCWTHSEWIDHAACSPLDACARGFSCEVHASKETVQWPSVST